MENITINTRQAHCVQAFVTPTLQCSCRPWLLPIPFLQMFMPGIAALRAIPASVHAWHGCSPYCSCKCSWLAWLLSMLFLRIFVPGMEALHTILAHAWHGCSPYCSCSRSWPRVVGVIHALHTAHSLTIPHCLTPLRTSFEHIDISPGPADWRQICVVTEARQRVLRLSSNAEGARPLEQGTGF